MADDRMVIYANSNVTRGKFAAAAVHAALTAVGAHHGGPVIVLGAKPSEIAQRATVIRDAGKTEVEPGTVTAGTDWQTSPKLEHHDEGTLRKVYDALIGALPDKAEWEVRDIVNAMQNEGILFRERAPEPTDDMRRAVFEDVLRYRLLPGEVREYLTGYLEAMDEDAPEPQTEPTDAQVLAALNAYYADYMIGPNKSLGDVRPPRTVQDMRAALRAAAETTNREPGTEVKGEGRG